jgi:hypothetical protein
MVQAARDAGVIDEDVAQKIMVFQQQQQAQQAMLEQAQQNGMQAAAVGAPA